MARFEVDITVIVEADNDNEAYAVTEAHTHPSEPVLDQ